LTNYPPDPKRDPAPASAQNADVSARLTPTETRLLVVDDDRDSADALSMVLEGYGYQVATAYRHAEALREFEAFKPDVALFDLSRPEPDGFELARAIRLVDQSAVLLAITGYALDEDIKAAEDAGFNRHFSKPVDPKLIRQFIDTLQLPTRSASD
jgi:two-component system CheB/CheR fusion protein